MINEYVSQLNYIITQFYPENISQNSIFIGFLGAAIVGSAGWYGRFLLKAVYLWIRRLCFDEVILYSDSGALYYLEKYINRVNDLSKKRNVIIQKGSYDRNGPSPLVYSENESSSSQEPVFYALGIGNHFLKIGDHFCWILKERNEDKMGNARITFSIKAFGFNGKNSIKKCILQEIEMERSSNQVTMYVSDEHGNAFRSGFLEKRNRDTLFGSREEIDFLIQDLKEFSSKKAWYQKRGIPYRRGYLLEGPPGTGKTSIIKAVASMFSSEIYVLNLRGLKGDDSLSTFFRSCEHNSVDSNIFIVAIEDIDCIQASNDRVVNKDREDKESVTLSGLLNTIDGLGSSENMVLFMTTNRKEDLDKALIRDGRADVHLHIGELGEDEVSRYLKHFYEINAYSQELPVGLKITGAELQGICLRSPTVADAVHMIKNRSNI